MVESWVRLPSTSENGIAFCRVGKVLVVLGCSIGVVAIAVILYAFSHERRLLCGLRQYVRLFWWGCVRAQSAMVNTKMEGRLLSKISLSGKYSDEKLYERESTAGADRVAHIVHQSLFRQPKLLVPKRGVYTSPSAVSVPTSVQRRWQEHMS